MRSSNENRNVYTMELEHYPGMTEKSIREILEEASQRWPLLAAGVVIDAVRCAKLGLQRGLSGPLEESSAYYMKSPPRQMRDSVAHALNDAFIRGEPLGEEEQAELERMSAGD